MSGMKPQTLRELQVGHLFLLGDNEPSWRESVESIPEPYRVMEIYEHTLKCLNLVTFDYASFHLDVRCWQMVARMNVRDANYRSGNEHWYCLGQAVHV